LLIFAIIHGSGVRLEINLLGLGRGTNLIDGVRNGLRLMFREEELLTVLVSYVI
jgi:hypothetical protein